MTMTSSILKTFLIVYIVYSLLKFFEFLFRSDEAKKRGLRLAYSNNARIIRIFDNVILIVMLAVIALLFASGIEYLSFTTGLLVGMTLIQVYFHRFAEPLPPEKAPDPPVSALKLMSYSIQANPGKGWRELFIMTLLFIWALYMLLTRGFGLPA
jgi:hypothetical protein